MKRVVIALLLAALLCTVLCACNKEKSKISGDEAIKIVLRDLGADAEKSSDPHTHTGTYEGQECYDIYITVKGESMLYSVSFDGEILYKGYTEHSH